MLHNFNNFLYTIIKYHSFVRVNAFSCKRKYYVGSKLVKRNSLTGVSFFRLKRKNCTPLLISVDLYDVMFINIFDLQYLIKCKHLVRERESSHFKTGTFHRALLITSEQ